MLRFLFVLLLCLTIAQAEAQDHAWWQDNVNWDGVTHWSSYITSSPGKLGPNALPVPEVSTGRADSISSATIGGAAHFKPGDYTRNITTALNFALVKDRVSLDFYMVPIEWFDVSHEVKTEREIFYQHYYIRKAVGDIYINTNIQILRQKKHKLDAALRLGLKTASSNNQGGARFTNAPGYYFDASVGKSFNSTAASVVHRLYAMAGIYVWQTNYDWKQQDDSFLFGAGYQARWRSLTLEQSLSGYIGYLNNGDRPLIYKASVIKNLGQFTASVYYWNGLYDYTYQSIGGNISYAFANGSLLK